MRMCGRAWALFYYLFTLSTLGHSSYGLGFLFKFGRVGACELFISLFEGGLLYSSLWIFRVSCLRGAHVIYLSYLFLHIS